MRAPKFWYNRYSLWAIILVPFGWLYYGFSSIWSLLRRRYKVSIPVICIGNLTMGGAGKTPVAILLAKKLQALGKKVHFVSRGYKGSLKGPIRVIFTHTLREVGDEPLILSRVAPTWVSKCRFQGAEAAVKAGADVIILDDGYQNPTIEKNLSFLVIDSYDGFGNCCLFPAGPLRELPIFGMKRAQVIILIGRGDFQVPSHIPRIRIEFKPLAEDLISLKNKKVILFAGIGRPEKFFRMMKYYEAFYQYEIVNCIPFADHHIYQTSDIERLVTQGKELEAVLVTTEKDFIKFNSKYRIYCIRLVLEIIEGDWMYVEQQISQF